MPDGVKERARRCCALAKSLELALDELVFSAQSEKGDVRLRVHAGTEELRLALVHARGQLEPLAWPKITPAPTAPRAAPRAAPGRRDVDD